MTNDARLIQEVAEAIPGLFASLGISASVGLPGPNDGIRPDLNCSVDIEGREIRFDVEVKGRWSQAILDQINRVAHHRGNGAQLLVLPKLSRVVRLLLKERHVNHADLSGVMYLNAPGIRVDVDGDPSRRPSRPRQPARDINPFSKKASLVLRALFAAPRAHMRVSELASRTGLAAGWASEVSDSLVRRGYAERTAEGIRLSDPASALRDWSVAYDWKKNPRRVFVVPFAHDELASRLQDVFKAKAVDWALTLLAGAQQRVGHVRYSAMMYVYASPSEGKALESALNELHAQETDDEGGLAVLNPYYGKAALFGVELVNRNPVVSDIQLFLDLAHFPVRGPEMAEMLVRRRLASALELRADDVKRLLRDLA